MGTTIAVITHGWRFVGIDRINSPLDNTVTPPPSSAKPKMKPKRHAVRRPKPKATRRTRKEVPQHSLGQNIRKARTKAGITQLALAHKIGYTGHDAGAYISRVESDTQAPRIDTLLRIAEALQVTMCSLLTT